MPRKKKNGLLKDVVGFGTAGLATAGLSAGIGSTGGAVGANVQAGLGTAARGFSPIGKLIVVKHVVRQTRKLTPKRRRKR
jgi:hypothetical protein